MQKSIWQSQGSYLFRRDLSLLWQTEFSSKPPTESVDTDPDTSLKLSFQFNIYKKLIDRNFKADIGGWRGNLQEWTYLMALSIQDAGEENIKAQLLALVFTVLCLCLVWAKPALPDQATARELFLPTNSSTLSVQTERVPTWSFYTPPVSVMTSYWDYMIGSYDTTPIRTVQGGYGGYFITYMGQRTPTSQRRVFYTRVNAAGAIENNIEMTNQINREGYSTMIFDQEIGKPIQMRMRNWKYSACPMPI